MLDNYIIVKPSCSTTSWQLVVPDHPKPDIMCVNAFFVPSSEVKRHDTDMMTQIDRHRPTVRARQKQTDRPRQTDTERQTQTKRHRQTHT